MNHKHPPSELSKRPPLGPSKRLPPRPSRFQGSSSGAKKLKMVSEKVDEQPCWKETSPQLDLYSAVKVLHNLSSEDLGNLLRDAENGILIYDKKDGSSCEIKVENLAWHLATSITKNLDLSVQHFRYLLRGLRLLHNLCDIASHHSTLERVLVEDTHIRRKILNSIIHLIDFLSQSGEKINGSSQMVLLYPALLSSSMYLLKALISSKWRHIIDVLLAHSKIDEFAITAFTALHVVINLLQAKLPAQHIDSSKKSNVNEVYCLSHLCESSLQFLQALCKHMLFRERLLNNKELCGGGVVLKLVQSTLKLSHCKDPNLKDVVYRLKSKVLSIMLLLCKAENSSFVDMAYNTTQSKDLVESAVFEVLGVLKMMFCGDLKDHPKGLLQLNAMKLIEMFSGDSRFSNFIISNLTEALIQVVSQPPKEFLSTWCSNDRESSEEDSVMDFDSISSAVAQVLGLISTLEVQHSTWNNFQDCPRPHAHNVSSFLVKILVNLTYVVPNSYEAQTPISEFLKRVQDKFSKLPGGSTKRTDAPRKNLSSLLAHAESLTPDYLNEQEVNVLRWLITQLEKILAAQESDIHRAMAAHSSAQCPSPTPQRPSPNEHDESDTDTDEDVPVNLAVVPFVHQSNDLVGEDQMTDLDEPVNTINDVEEFRGVQSEEQQQNKRKRSIMNDIQRGMIEKALLDKLILQRRDGSLQFWAAKLSLHGSEITPSKLRTWLSNHKAKQRREAAKDARAHSDGPEKQSGSGHEPKSDSPESHNDEDHDPSPSVSRRTHRKDRRGSVLRVCGSKSTQDTVEVPTSSFKHRAGQWVMVKDDQGKEIGNARIHLTRGVWFGKDLKESMLCVVDVEDIKVPDGTKLPHPTDAGTTFSEAKAILCKTRVLWDSCRLFLIQ